MTLLASTAKAGDAAAIVGGPAAGGVHVTVHQQRRSDGIPHLTHPDTGRGRFDERFLRKPHGVGPQDFSHRSRFEPPAQPPAVTVSLT